MPSNIILDQSALDFVAWYRRLQAFALAGSATSLYHDDSLDDNGNGLDRGGMTGASGGGIGAAAWQSWQQCLCVDPVFNYFPDVMQDPELFFVFKEMFRTALKKKGRKGGVCEELIFKDTVAKFYPYMLTNDVDTRRMRSQQGSQVSSVRRADLLMQSTDSKEKGSTTSSSFFFGSTSNNESTQPSTQRSIDAGTADSLSHKEMRNLVRDMKDTLTNNSAQQMIAEIAERRTFEPFAVDELVRPTLPQIQSTINASKMVQYETSREESKKQSQIERLRRTRPGANRSRRRKY